MLFAILTIITYIGALLLIMPTLAQIELNKKPNIKAVLALGFSAVALHFIDVSRHLFVENGQNFTIVNVISLFSLMISLVATLALVKWRTVWFPLSIVYALGIVSVALSTFVEGSVIKQIAQNLGLMSHLAMAIFAYALFFIALLYVFQLKWLDSRLKSKKMPLSPVLPPLMTVEKHFFTLTLLAQVLLSLALVSGMIYLHNFFAPEHIHKAIFSFMAWVVYTILLLGLWKLHWRGKRVLIYSVSGMILLTFSYFGSRI